MEVQFGPNSVDEPNLLYKLQRKIKVFNTTEPLPNRGYNLVASSSKYGLVFVAVPDGTLMVYYLKQLVDKECEPQHLKVQLQEKPTYIAVSCDYELLAVTGGQLLSVYKVADFQNSNVSPSITIRTEVNLSTFVSSLQWNPCIPDSIAIAYYDGTLLACHVNSGQIKKVPSKARCICWSPKGKQLVTGNSDGTLIQFKPDLTAAKIVPAPNLFEGSPVEALAIYWISTFQFAVVYKNASDNSRPAVTIINTPKAGQPSCLNYEDICFSMGSNRPWYYFLQGLAQWNIIMTSSSNSMEMGTLGSADGANWIQWCQTDEARPELPLTDKKIENYPVGISIDTCAIHQLPWGENDTLPHMPLLHVVSQNGLLTTFNIINLKKDAVQVCTPPQLLSLPTHAMSSSVPGEVPAQPAPAPAPAPAPKKEPQVSALQQALQSKAAAPQSQPANQFGNATSQFGIASSQFGNASSQFGSATSQFGSATSQFGSATSPFGAATSQFASTTASAAIKIPSFTPQAQPTLSFDGANAFGSTAQAPEQKPALEIKPVAAPQPQAPVAQPKPQPAAPPKPQPTPQQAQKSAALTAEQEKINKDKANQELKNMLVKEVNDFQMELYNFMVKTRETQARLQRDIQTINTNFNGTSLDTESLKKECCIEELRGAIVQLKLELVRACAVVAEARTHADAKDLHQWTQPDPLTTKRVESVKKLAYYVQTQLEQAHKALDYKWNEFSAKDPEFNKPGKHMIRPILDDVYQPLVKQQEILGRQQAVLRALRSTLADCDVGPVFKSTSLLRSTPFRNKDPLSKLTKNILNMSLEPQTTKPKQSLLTAQKLDALRDVLSNHKTVKIKPVNVELRQHLAAMRKNYEKSLLAKAQAAKIEPEVKPQAKPAPPPPKVKIEPKFEPLKQTVSTPAFTLVSNIKPPPSSVPNVARTLFTDEPKQKPPKPLPQIQRPISKPFASAPTSLAEPAPVDTKSVLKDKLTNKQPLIDAKNNTFMGQKICSPTSAQSSAPTPSSAPSAVFTSKPIADINNMFNKFQPQPFVPETKSTLNFKASEKPQTVPNVKSSETGEPDEVIDASKPFDPKPKEPIKPITNLFAMKTTPLATSTPSVPDVLKTSIQEQKVERKILVKPVEKLIEKTKENVPEKSSETVPEKSSETVPETSSEKFPEKSRENVPEKSSENVPEKSSENVPEKSNDNVSKAAQKVADKKETLKPLNILAANKGFAFGASKPSDTVNAGASSEPKPLDLKAEAKTETPKVSEKPDSTVTSSATSIFATANASAPKPQSAFTPPASTKSETPTTKTSESDSKPTDLPTPPASASSIFSAAVASQPKSTNSIFSSSPTSVFTSTTQSSQPSVFGTSKPSIFSTSPPASSVFGQTSTTASVFSSTAASVFASASSPQPPSPSATAFATPTTNASVFGSTTTTASSVFGSAPTTPVFGAATTAPTFGTTTASVFGSATPSTQSSVFGTTSTTQAPFGSTETPSAFTPTTTSASIFGTATTTASLFATPTTQASAFGQSGQSVFGTATTQASIFGGTATQSVFGSSTQSATSVFGTPTTQASVFGTPTQTTQASIFGTPTPTTQASVFGTPTQANQASVFGTPTQTTQASIFGQSAPAAGGSLFGGGEANLFAAASISTTSASGGSIFGGSASGGSVFGGGSTNVFGAKTTFGQPNAATTNIFGGGASFGQKPATNIWGSGGESTGSGFGSSGGFGQQGTTQASSIFGGTTGGSFSQPSAGAFGSPQQPSAFGSPQQQPQASAFGGSPAFGSKPVFGQPVGFGSPTGGFGAPATFGGFNKSPGGGFGAPAFGGGGGGFGGSSPGGFGSPTQSNATFESLATQNTLTFGNLAQQSPPVQQAQPSFNTSPSFTGWRG